MSITQSTLNKPEAQFIAFANTINSQCKEHKTEWNIDNAKLTTFDSLLSTANDAYETNSNKATKNAVTVANKNSAIAELKRFLGSFITYIEINDSVPDAAIEAMGLRPRHRTARQPLARPNEQLLLSVKKLHDEMIVYAQRPEHGQSTTSVAPTRYHGFILRYRIDGDEQYQIAISTRLRHTIRFDRANEGKRVFLSAAWVNPRLENGPWCNEISEIIG
jgi:hypothetical protein